MKIRLISDLHTEFAPLEIAPAGEDILIMAGDIGIHTHGVDFAKEIAGQLDIPVIVISGNHEFYQNRENRIHTWESTLVDCHDAADFTDRIEPGKVTFFENGCATYQGVRFIGATLWTDMEYFSKNPMVKYEVEHALNDYYVIESEARWGGAITSDDTIDRHQESIAFFRAQLAEKFDGPTVVISHHTPSSLSVPEEFKLDHVTAGYSSRLEEFILDHEPTLWVHGHCHQRFSYSIGNTRIECNPRGYPGQETGFDPNLIIEI